MDHLKLRHLVHTAAAPGRGWTQDHAAARAAAAALGQAEGNHLCRRMEAFLAMAERLARKAIASRTRRPAVVVEE